MRGLVMPIRLSDKMVISAIGGVKVSLERDGGSLRRDGIGDAIIVSRHLSRRFRSVGRNGNAAGERWGLTWRDQIKRF